MFNHLEKHLNTCKKSLPRTENRKNKIRPVPKAFVSSFIRTLHTIAIDHNQNDMCHFVDNSRTLIVNSKMWLSDVFQCTKNLRFDYEKREALETELEKYRFKICSRDSTSFSCFNWKFDELASDDKLSLIKNNAHITKNSSIKTSKSPSWRTSPTRSPSPLEYSPSRRFSPGRSCGGWGTSPLDVSPLHRGSWGTSPLHRGGWGTLPK